MLDKGLIPIFLQPSYGEGYLLHVWQSRNLEQAWKSDDKNPLHLAAIEGDIGRIHSAIEIGIDIDSQARNGYTALDFSIANENISVMNQLLRLGASFGDYTRPLAEKSNMLRYLNRQVFMQQIHNIEIRAQIINYIVPTLISGICKITAQYIGGEGPWINERQHWFKDLRQTIKEVQLSTSTLVTTSNNITKPNIIIRIEDMEQDHAHVLFLKTKETQQCSGKLGCVIL